MIYMGNSNRNSSGGGGAAGHSAQFSVVRTDGAKKNNQNNNSNRRESCQKFKASVSQSAKLASPTGKSPEAQRERFSRNASLSLIHSCPAWCPVREEEPEVVASGHHQSHEQTVSTAQTELSQLRQPFSKILRIPSTGPGPALAVSYHAMLVLYCCCCCNCPVARCESH